MHVLFYCNTYMQVIAAIQLKRKLYKNARVDLILTDHSANAEEVAKRIEKTELFERVRFCRTKHMIFEQNVIADFFDILRGIFSLDEKYEKLLWKNDKQYDQIFYYNLDILLYTIFDLSIQAGTIPKCNRFEEGLNSYYNMISYSNSKRMQVIRKLRLALGKRDVFAETNDFYCYYSDIFPFKEDAVIHRIPALDRYDDELIKLLNTVFDYEPQNADFHQKYLFFGSSADIDGNNVDEAEMVKEIAHIVGTDNLLVKTHPRDSRNVYSDSGIAVMTKSSVPWEVIQINHDFSKHRFLTLASGSVVTASAMLNDAIFTRYFYPMRRAKNEAFFQYCETNIRATLEKVQKLNRCQTHIIVEECESLESILMDKKN